jgi:tellurite resistance protein TehA-like permease
MAYYESIFLTLEEFGLFDVFLPFLLIFSLVYLIAQSIPHVGDKEAGILALVVGLIAIATHVTDFGGGTIDVVDFIHGIIPGLTGIIVGVIAIFFVLAVVAPKFVSDIKEHNISPPTILILIALILAIYLIVSQAGILGPGSSVSLGFMGSWLEDPENVTWVVMLIVFGASIWFIVRGDNKTNEQVGQEEKMLSKLLRNLFLGNKYKEKIQKNET